MSTRIVTYGVGDAKVEFEIEADQASGEYVPASGGRAASITQIREAIAPAIAGAKEALDSARELSPDEVQVKFGIKASGTMNWWVAKAATEGNFEITLTWNKRDGDA